MLYGKQTSCANSKAPGQMPDHNEDGPTGTVIDGLVHMDPPENDD